MPKPKVLSLGEPQYVDKEWRADFESKFDLHVLPTSDRKTMVKRVADKVASDGPFEAACILMNNGQYEPFDEELFGPLIPQLKIIGSVNAGYSEFDMDYFNKNKVVITNTLTAVAEPTADIAIFLMLAAMRDTSQKELFVRQGGWREAKTPPTDPNGKTLGIIGMGKIGRHVARKAAVFGMKIQYFNRTRLSVDLEQQSNATYCSTLAELLSTSDVISINTPLTAETNKMLGKKEFALMKDGVFIVNTGRGAVIDEEAFIDALESGKVARAGLDVFVGEPKINPYFVKSYKCAIQPHMGSWTDVAWRNACQEAMDNITALFETGKANSQVNSW